MENISLSGMTPEQAFVAIEKCVGETLPDHIKDLVKQLVGDDGKLGTFAFHFRPGETMDAHFVARIDTEDQRETALRAIHDSEFLDSDLGVEMRKKYGIVKYNGAVGDSCPCAACNYRRLDIGVDLAKDREDDLTRVESENRVTEEYAKLGMKVPADKTTEAGLKSFEQINPAIIDLLKDILGFKEETLDEKAAKARAGLVRRFGADSEVLVDFDRVHFLVNKKDKTLAESLEALEKMARLHDLPL